MGSGFSGDGTALVESPFAGQQASSLPTARVIFMDGSLKDFPAASGATTTSDVLGGCGGRVSSFVCASSGLRRGCYAVALGRDDPLDHRELHFVLPVAMLGRRLAGADMAAIAARASAALAKSVTTRSPRRPPDERCRRLRRHSPVVAPTEKMRLNTQKATVEGGSGARIPRRVPQLPLSSKQGSSRRRMFDRRVLGTIMEEDGE